jgi:hypothetical protein
MKMSRFVLLMPLLLPGAVARGVTLASTSFEEPVIPVNSANVASSEYQDNGANGGAGVDHPLPNLPTFTPVNYTSVGGELGFTAHYINSQGGLGLTDAGGLNGVNSFSSDQILAAPHGTKRYLLSDTDGRVVVTLDSVDLSTAVNPQVSLDVFFRSSSGSNYETTPVLDWGRVWVELSNAPAVTLLDTRPNDIDLMTIGGQPITGRWTSLSAALPAGGTATLKFELETNSAAESMGIDNIVFTAVPEPTGGLMALVAALALAGRRWSAKPKA